MSTTGTEKHCRLCLMLTKGGAQTCRYLVIKRVNELCPKDNTPYPWTIQQFLDSKKETIKKSKISKKNFEVLFPKSGETDLSKWDLPLVCTILILYCDLPSVIQLDVTYLQTLRNELCHMSEPNITDPDFKDKAEVIQVIVSRILARIDDPDVKQEIENIMKSVETEPLSLGETLKEMHRFYTAERDIYEKLEHVEETVLQKLEMLDVINMKLDQREETSGANSECNNLLVPGVDIFLDIRNVTEDEEEKMSEVLQQLFEEVIQEDAEFKSSLQDDSYVSLRNAVKRTFQLFLSKGWRILTAKHRCILLHIQCSSFKSLATLFREQIDGHIDKHLKDLSQALNNFVIGKTAYLESVIYRDEFWNVLDKSISSVEDLFTLLDNESCVSKNAEGTGTTHSLSLTVKRIKNESDQPFEEDDQNELESVLQLMKTELEHVIHGSEISIQTRITPSGISTEATTKDEVTLQDMEAVQEIEQETNELNEKRKTLEEEFKPIIMSHFKGEGHSKDEKDITDMIGICTPIKTPLFFSLKSRKQVMNNGGGCVFRLDDFKRLQRFLIMGSQNGNFFEKAEKLTRQNVSCLDRIIGVGRGVEVVQTIKEISVNRRNVKHHSIIWAYSVCARCGDVDAKRAAYAAISEICRTPTHLFKFVGLCQLESSTDGVDTVSQGTGWGRAHKRGISKWYTDFVNRPEKLARLVSKYKSREPWSHKDLLKLSHVSTRDKPVGFIIRYILKGLEKAKEMYIDGLSDTDKDFKQLKRLEELFTAFNRTSICQNEQELCLMIREYELTWEQCNSELLKSKEVWIALLPHMPIAAAVQNLGRMTCYGLFAEDSEDENIILEKILSIGNTYEAPDEGTTPVGADIETEDAVAEEQDGSVKARRKHFLHPFKILQALKFYKSGKGDRGKLKWVPNQKIISALDTAFYQAFETVIPTGKKFYLAVDVSSPMSCDVLDSGLSCSTAAAAMMMVTARIEEKCIIKGFNHDIINTGIKSTDSLADVEKIMSVLTSGPCDCTRPVYDAMEKRIKDIDVFVVYTASETNLGKCHPCEAIRFYRQYSERPRAKLIVVGMCATEFTIADQDDPDMLDLAGFDPMTPRLISEFAMGNI